LGAGVVNPRTQNVTHIDIKSQKERHTINRAELAAITSALGMENTSKYVPHNRYDATFTEVVSFR
jgi:hypothetical protein